MPNLLGTKEYFLGEGRVVVFCCKDCTTSDQLLSVDREVLIIILIIINNNNSAIFTSHFTR